MNLFKMMALTLTTLSAACSLAVADPGDPAKPAPETLTECLVMAGCHEVPQCGGAPECAQVGDDNGRLLYLFSCPSKPSCANSAGESLAVSP